MHFNRRIIFFEVEPKDMHVKNTVPFLNTAKFDNWSTSPPIPVLCVSVWGHVTKTGPGASENQGSLK